MRSVRVAHRTVWWALVALVSYAAILTPLIPQQGLRYAVVLTFLLWAPGAAVVGAVPEIDPPARWALASGVSVALVLLVSVVMLEWELWHPRGAVLVGATACCSFALAALLRPALRRPVEEEAC